MNDLTLPLLGALSSTELAVDNPLEQQLNKLRESVTRKVLPALQESSYVAKGRTELALNRCLADAATLCGLPFFLGKACIGIVPGDLPLDRILPLLGPDMDDVGAGATSLPHMLFDDGQKPRLQALSLSARIISLAALTDHDAEAPLNLTPEEHHTLIALSKDGIEPRDVVSALLRFGPLHRVNSSYLLLPPEEFARPGSGKLIAQCNAMLLLSHVTNSVALQTLRDNFTMPIYIVSDGGAYVKEMVKYLSSRYAGRTVEVVPVAQVGKLLDRLNTPVNRITVRDRLLAEMLNVEEELSRKIHLQDELQKALKKDSMLVSSKQASLEKIFDKFQKNLSDGVKALEKEKKKFSESCEDSLNIAKALEEQLSSATPQKNLATKAVLHSGVMRPASLWRRIILRALVSGHTDLAEQYQTKFAALYPEQAFLTGLYIFKHKNLTLSHEQISKLQNMAASPEVLRAKIYLRKELGMSEQDCANIAPLLPRQKDSAEKYYFARHLNEVYQTNKKAGISVNPSFDEVITAFKDAIFAGSQDAAELFARFCGGEARVEEAKEIADMGNPVGAYIYRLLAITRKDSKMAERYLKMATALGHPKAVALSAEKCWENRLSGEAVHFNHESGRLDGLNLQAVADGIGMYEYLLKHPELARSVANCGERLGYFYFCNRQWQQSRYYIGIAPVTPEGCFCLGIMLKYGNGGNQSKKDAIAKIREAENLSGPFATLAHNVKAKWFQDDMAKI